MYSLLEIVRHSHFFLLANQSFPILGNHLFQHDWLVLCRHQRFLFQDLHWAVRRVHQPASRSFNLVKRRRRSMKHKERVENPTCPKYPKDQRGRSNSQNNNPNSSLLNKHNNRVNPSKVLHLPDPNQHLKMFTIIYVQRVFPILMQKGLWAILIENRVFDLM